MQASADTASSRDDTPISQAISVRIIKDSCADSMDAANNVHAICAISSLNPNASYARSVIEWIQAPGRQS